MGLQVNYKSITEYVREPISIAKNIILKKKTMKQHSLGVARNYQIPVISEGLRTGAKSEYK